MRKKILLVIGTRPEAIKMAPVIWEMQRRRSVLQPVVCLTGQHRELLDQTIQALKLPVDIDLKIMKRNQSLDKLTASLLVALGQVFSRVHADMVLVQGDTTTTLAASLCAFYRRIPIGHIEAGLRTFDKFRPFPEEINRRLTSHLGDLHFAPTPIARKNLLREGIPPGSIYVTGNTVVDSLLEVVKRLESGELRPPLRKLLSQVPSRFILVTAHRRESHGAGLREIFSAIREVAGRIPGCEFVLPVHLNPAVQDAAREMLGSVEGVHLIPPLDYVSFVWLMRKSILILSDSGGIQEEAPSLGKLVLVVREKTERPEAVQAGFIKVVGCRRDKIVRSLLEAVKQDTRALPRKRNPYGDGRAASRIVQIIERVLVQNGGLKGDRRHTNLDPN
jgi:UDP-N-acetylglucosamine 2-epimerase